jgi:hypothetical protein
MFSALRHTQRPCGRSHQQLWLEGQNAEQLVHGVRQRCGALLAAAKRPHRRGNQVHAGGAGAAAAPAGAHGALQAQVKALLRANHAQQGACERHV